MRRWLARIVAALRRLWGNLTPGRLEPSATSTFALPANQAEVESVQAGESCPTPLTVPDSDPVQTPAVGPGPELKITLSTSLTTEDEAGRVAREAEPSQNETRKLDDDQIPRQERCDAGHPFGTVPTSVSVPLVNGGGQAIGAGEELEAQPPVIGGQEPSLKIEVPESPTTPSGPRTTRVAPEKRGGRRRGSPTADQAQSSEVSKRNEQTQKQRPEIVCWLQGMTWVVGVEVPEELQLPSLQVWQPPDVALEEEGSRSGRWRLKQPLEAVEFIATEPDEIRAMPLAIPAVPYRIFKVIGTHGTRGRAVRQGSAGRFLVVVPESWRWDEELSGLSTSTAEYVSPGTCRAHHVDLPLDAGRALAFNTLDGDCVRIPCAGQRFDLVGVRIDDASEEAGPLFVGEPPQLRWSVGITEDAAIATIVVGEEGLTGRQRGWRVHGERFDDLRLTIAGRRAGWFFVRLYDSRDELVESLDFRFVADLDAIDVEACSPVPSIEGHPPARIRFRHGRGCSVRSGSPSLIVKDLLPDGSTVIVPPDTQFDETLWLIGPVNGPHADVTVLVERVWWAHVNEGEETNRLQWTDRRLKLSREDFKATSVTAISLRVPRQGWADEVQIGFEAARSRSVHLGASERECVVPLRDLGESREVEEQAAARLSIWLTPRGRTGERLEAVVGFLPAAVSPPLEDNRFLRSLKQIEPRSLMTTLSRVGVACRGPLRRIISDLRTESYERIPKRQRGTACELFMQEGLCVLALALDQIGVLNTRGINLPERWARRARAAQARFPRVMSAVRSRYQEIDEEYGRKHRSRPRRKAD